MASFHRFGLPGASARKGLLGEGLCVLLAVDCCREREVVDMDAEKLQLEWRS